MPDSSPPGALDRLSIAIIEDFERAWLTGRPASPEYLARHPDRPAALARELAAIDMENRFKHGKPAAAEDYLPLLAEARAPEEHVSDLRRVADRFRSRYCVSSLTMGDDGAPEPWSDRSAGGLSRFSAGDRLAHYRLVRPIGRGAFGTVWEAFDEKLQRQVAIKLLGPELAATAAARQRFLREARAMAAVSHENVVRVYAVEEEPTPFLAMEFVNGPTLQARLDADAPLEPGEVVRIARQIAAALAAAHDMGLIHRDVKPANVLLERGAEGRVKLTDFGLARAADDTGMTRTGSVVGTPMYMAPEQALGETVDQRADLFSLGSVMYAMACGRPPFHGRSTVAVIRRVVEEAPEPIPTLRPDTPRWLVNLIARLHRKNPAERFQSAHEVERIFAQAQADPAAMSKLGAREPAKSTEHGGILRKLAPWPQKLMVKIGVAALFTVAGAILAGGLPRRGREHVESRGDPPGRPAGSTAVPMPPPAVMPFDAVQARAHQEAWAEHLGVPVETSNSIGMRFALIPPGEFAMHEGDRRIVVTLTRPYLIGHTEVTQRQWRGVMETEPWKGQPNTTEADDVPATHVSWDDANAFCDKLTILERAAGRIGPGGRYRLPTEAEWEHACRAGTLTAFSFGTDGSRIGDHAWFGGGWNVDGPVPGGNTADAPQARPVGGKTANPWGLVDVHGNVWEWVTDRQAPLPSGDTALTDPAGPAEGSFRGYRGGSFTTPPAYLRSFHRGGYVPTFRSYDVGFRVVLGLGATEGRDSLAPASPQ